MMNTIRNAWYVAGFSSELNDTNLIARRLVAVDVVMFRSGSGSVVALEDRCPHRMLPLSLGKRVGDDIQCGYHGMKFSEKGACVAAPGQTTWPKSACVRTYPLEDQDGLLWFWPGDQSKADVNLIPDMHWNEDAEWAVSRGYHYVKADFRLANDNLLDLSHETYVHEHTVGNSEEETIASYPMTVTVDNECLVRAHREMPNIDPPPFFELVLNHKGRIDRWQTAIHVAPGFNMTDFGVYPVGTPREKAFRSHVIHLLTPESETTTHYFWSLTRNYRLDDDKLTEDIRVAVNQTFNEDSAVLEAQQRQINVHPGNIPRIALRIDEPAIKARRLLDALVARESVEQNFVFRPPIMVTDSVPELIDIAG